MFDMPAFRLTKVVSPIVWLSASVGVAGLLSCGDATDPDDGLPTGSLEVVLEIAGNGTDSDGFVFVLRDTTYRIDAYDTIQIDGIPVGEHQYQLGNVEAHCVDKTLSPIVQVNRNATSTKHVNVECYGMLLFKEWYGPYDDQIFYLDESGNSRKLTPPQPGGQWSPSWSPDGTMVVYVRIERYEQDVYVADLNGNMQALAARPGVSEESPAWSPDGEWVVYIARDTMVGSFSQSNMRLVRPDGTGDHSILASDRLDLSPVWSPDGQWIAFACWDAEFGLCFIRPDGTDMYRANVELSQPQHLSWSPDGSRIAIEEFTNGQQVMIFNLETGDLSPTASDVQDITTFGGGTWSPEGGHLAVGATSNGEFQLYVTDRDGTNSQMLANNVRWHGDWSPDGLMLAFGLTPLAINICTFEGSGPRLLFDNDNIVVGTYWQKTHTPSAAVYSLEVPHIARVSADQHFGSGPPLGCRPYSRLSDRGRMVFSCLTDNDQKHH